MARRALLLIAVGLLSVGCSTPLYITPVIWDLDDNDVKVVVRTNDSKIEVEEMLPLAAKEAEKGCGRWDREPEYLSHIVIQEMTTVAEAFAEAFLVGMADGISQASGQPPVVRDFPEETEETIVRFLFACTFPTDR